LSIVKRDAGSLIIWSLGLGLQRTEYNYEHVKHQVNGTKQQVYWALQNFAVALGAKLPEETIED
jgi:hypothetical protein